MPVWALGLGKAGLIYKNHMLKGGSGNGVASQPFCERGVGGAGAG